jgi:hypothetical protein
MRSYLLATMFAVSLLSGELSFAQSPVASGSPAIRRPLPRVGTFIDRRRSRFDSDTEKASAEKLAAEKKAAIEQQKQVIAKKPVAPVAKPNLASKPSLTLALKPTSVAPPVRPVAPVVTQATTPVDVSPTSEIQPVGHDEYENVKSVMVKRTNLDDWKPLFNGKDLTNWNRQNSGAMAKSKFSMVPLPSVWETT